MSRQSWFARGARSAALIALIAAAPAAAAFDGKPSSPRVVEAGFHPGKPPAGLPAESAAALARLDSWSRDRDYKASACCDERVLYVSRLEGKARAARIASIETLYAAFEALLPEPARSAASAEPVAEWGNLHRPESGALLLVESAELEDYEALIDALKLSVSDEPALAYLGGWFDAQRGQPGLLCTDALTAVWQSAPADIEMDTVWRSQNELAHRLAHLLLYRRFGELPHWLRTAAAWHFEQLATGTIHCFPGRDGFVAVDGDHDGWRTVLTNEFKGRKKSPLQMSEFADWKRGTWDDAEAARAWGMFEYLVTKHPQRISALCEALRSHRVEHGKTTHADGSWKLVPNYAIPDSEQQQICAQHLGADFLEKAGAFFADWKGWKNPATLAKGKK
jgi:hypothetical protein